jgi:hypothetical protein
VRRCDPRTAPGCRSAAARRRGSRRGRAPHEAIPLLRLRSGAYVPFPIRLTVVSWPAMNSKLTCTSSSSSKASPRLGRDRRSGDRRPVRASTRTRRAGMRSCVLLRRSRRMSSSLRIGSSVCYGVRPSRRRAASVSGMPSMRDDDRGQNEIADDVDRPGRVQASAQCHELFDERAQVGDDPWCEAFCTRRRKVWSGGRRGASVRPMAAGAGPNTCSMRSSRDRRRARR